jgi:acyl dehydratase
VTETGLTGPTFSFAVEAAKIREFAWALGGLDPVHTDTEAARRAGYRDVVAPIGFLIWTLGQDGTEIFRRFGLEYDKGLAGSEGWDFYEPACAGDVLTGRTRYVGKEERQGRGGKMDVHFFDTEYHNQLGEVVQVEHSSVIQWERSPYESEARS